MKNSDNLRGIFFDSHCISQKVSFQVTPENAETQSWVKKTVWQRIPGRRARNRKTPTTITVTSITRNDHLPLTGGPQMLTTGDVGCLCTVYGYNSYSGTAELFREEIDTAAFLWTLPPHRPLTRPLPCSTNLHYRSSWWLETEHWPSQTILAANSGCWPCNQWTSSKRSALIR